MIISDLYFITPKVFKIEDKITKKSDFQNIFDTYIVKKGDTLTKIVEKEVRKLGLNLSKKELSEFVKKVAKDNDIKNPDLIYVGQKLKINLNKPVEVKRFFPVDGRITSKFGMRLDPFTKHLRFHEGLDIAAPVGTPIRSVISGKVIFSGKIRGYGNIVIIKNGDTITKYAHNSINLVKKGDYVKKGEVIAKVGATGRATGPHVHFEVVIKHRHIDPLKFLSA